MSRKGTSKKTTNSWDIEKGTVVIVEPLKRTPVDSISVLEKEVMRSLMPIPKDKTSYFFMQGNPLEREQKGMLQEDLASYIHEINDYNKFDLGKAKGIRKRKTKRRHNRKTTRRHNRKTTRRHNRKTRK
jgi:hypothetical protein